MTRAELIAKYRRLAEDNPDGTIVPIKSLCEQVVRDISGLDGDVGPLYVTTKEYAERKGGVTAKTVAHWCEAGKIDGARKTSDGRGGKWLIPRNSVN